MKGFDDIKSIKNLQISSQISRIVSGSCSTPVFLRKKVIDLQKRASITLNCRQQINRGRSICLMKKKLKSNLDLNLRSYRKTGTR